MRVASDFRELPRIDATNVVSTADTHFPERALLANSLKSLATLIGSSYLIL